MIEAITGEFDARCDWDSVVDGNLWRLPAVLGRGYWVVDIGSGSGAFAYACAARGASVLAIDSSLDRVRDLGGIEYDGDGQVHGLVARVSGSASGVTWYEGEPFTELTLQDLVQAIWDNGVNSEIPIGLLRIDVAFDTVAILERLAERDDKIAESVCGAWDDLEVTPDMITELLKNAGYDDIEVEGDGDGRGMFWAC